MKISRIQYPTFCCGYQDKMMTLSNQEKLPLAISKNDVAVSLYRSKKLLTVTQNILNNRLSILDNDKWLSEICIWADEFNLSEEVVPRQKETLLESTTLYLFQDNITYLPNAIGKLEHLNLLNIRESQITALPESIGCLRHLDKLYIRGTQLTTLPESIKYINGLTEIDIRWNQLTNLPESLGQLSHLTELYLSWNQLIALPESIGCLSNLVELDISKNHLTTLPESIIQLKNLEWFYYADNPLQDLSVEVQQFLNRFGQENYGRLKG